MAQQNMFPKIDLTTFFLSISSAAFMGLGLAPPAMGESEPQAGPVDLELARQNIDLLELMCDRLDNDIAAARATVTSRRGA